MRNRKIQRALRRAGIRKEERIGGHNGERYADPVPREAVREIIREERAVPEDKGGLHLRQGGKTQGPKTERSGS